MATATDPTQAVPVTPPAPTPLRQHYSQRAAMPAQTAAVPGTAATAPTALSSMPGVSLSATNPTNDLRGQTIAPNQTADRNAIAQSQIQNWNTSTDPQFQADIRSATSNSAALGQLGSGQLRTSLGDLVANRDVQRNAVQSDYLNNALTGSIQDTYNNVGIAQQQQQYQTGLQNQTFGQNYATQQLQDQEGTNAFNQSLAGTQLQNATQAQQFGQGTAIAQLQDQLTNSSFSRALQQLLAGNQGNPADTQLALSQLYGNEASQAGTNVANLVKGTTANNASQNPNSYLQQILQQYGITLPTQTGSLNLPTSDTGEF